MSETPRTDAVSVFLEYPETRYHHDDYHRLAAEAEKMEKELAAALAANQRLEKERDEAYGKQEALQYTAEERERYALHVAQANEWTELRAQVASLTAEQDAARMQRNQKQTEIKSLQGRLDQLKGLR